MLKFYLCKTCGNLIMKIEDGGTTPVCCGRTMSELAHGLTDGSLEKHVPVIQVLEKDDGLKEVHVEVGALPHPTENYHFIQWIILETDKRKTLKMLDAGDKSEAFFIIRGDETLLRAYAYCNLHGMWVSE